MYSIGEISKIVNVSIDALRYYDEIGLLKPHHINEKSRYRYYSNDQIRDLMFILEMKEYGFSLDAIRELLVSDNPARIEAALKNRSRQLALERDNTLKTIRQLNQRLDQMEGAGERMKQTTVLIIDDAAFMRHVLGDIFANNGYTVAGEAATGEEGIRKYGQLRPDMVIMDIHMPEGLDGIQAAGKIKELDKDANIVMCSARGAPEQVLRSIQNGARAFVVKPFQAKDLLNSMCGLLENKQELDIHLVSGWLSDESVRERFPDEPVAQAVIDRLFAICSSGETNSDDRLMELLAEI